ncbi:MAG: TatD family hydrolase [Marinirhabdus sp.]
MLVDTHTHLYSEAFDGDRAQVMQRCEDEGIDRFFVPAIDSSYLQAMYQLERDYPKKVFLMMGLHPTSVKEGYEKELEIVENEFKKRKFIAVGEIGIDLYWDKSTLAFQQNVFKRQIKLAKEHKLPIVIHCRDAFNEVFDVLETEKGNDLFGILHCFTGDKAQAQRAIGYNMKLGIGGAITYKNSKIAAYLHEIPLRHIVLETDSPYLAPVPHRCKRNESSYLKKICGKVAEVYTVPPQEVARITTENSKEVFGV